MSHNITPTGVTVILIALIIGAAGGFIVGKESNKPEPHTVSSIVVRQTIEPYTGIGSGVLKHGTIIEGDYKGPESIVGHFENIEKYPGTWVIHKLVTEK